MRKDPTEWREGFKRWKETGESPWKAGKRLPKFTIGTEGENMNYEYRGTIYDDELKNQGITHVAELPEVVVTGKDRRPMYQRYDAQNSTYNPDDVITGFNILTFGGLNNLSPSQWARRVYDLPKLIDGRMNTSQYFGKWINGNEGIVTSKFSKEHPYWSIGANALFDGVTVFVGGGGANSLYRGMSDKYGFQIGKSFYRDPERFYRQVEHIPGFNTEAIDDAVNSGIIRSNNKQWKFNPYFSKGKYNNSAFNSTENVALIESKANLQDGFAYVQDGTMNIDPLRYIKEGESAFPLNMIPESGNFTYWTPFKKFGIRGWKRNEFAVKPKQDFATPSINAENIENSIAATSSTVEKMIPERDLIEFRNATLERMANARGLNGPERDAFIKKGMQKVGYKYKSTDNMYNSNASGETVPSTGEIRIKPGEEEFAMGHEMRHRLDYTNVWDGTNDFTLTKDEYGALRKAFGGEFLDYNDSPAILREMVTTNGDVRRALLGKYNLRKLSVEEQNKIIDNATGTELLNALKNSNDYGREYYKALVTNDVYLANGAEQLKNILRAMKESLKKVGIVATPYTLYNTYTE